MRMEQRGLIKSTLVGFLEFINPLDKFNKSDLHLVNEPWGFVNSVKISHDLFFFESNFPDSCYSCNLHKNKSFWVLFFLQFQNDRINKEEESFMDKSPLFIFWFYLKQLVDFDFVFDKLCDPLFFKQLFWFFQGVTHWQSFCVNFSRSCRGRVSSDQHLFCFMIHHIVLVILSFVSIAKWYLLDGRPCKYRCWNYIRGRFWLRSSQSTVS